MNKVYVITCDTCYLNDKRCVGVDTDILDVCGSFASCLRRVLEIITNLYNEIDDEKKEYFNPQIVDSEGNFKWEYIRDQLDNYLFLDYFCDGSVSEEVYIYVRDVTE